MAIETTPLGYQLPDGDEPIWEGDNVISHNGRLSQTLLADLRARAANLEEAAGFGGDPLAPADSAVAWALTSGTETPVALQEAMDGSLTQLQTEIDRKQTAIATFAELKAAVAAGGRVEISSAPITITETLNVVGGTLIRGGNLTLPAGANYPAFKVQASNVSIESGWFTGGGAYVDGARFVYAVGTLGSYLKNVHVRNCRMDQNSHENVRFQYVRNFSVVDCTMDTFQYAGFMGLSVENGAVQGNTITNAVMASPLVNSYGIALSDTDNTVAARSRRVRVVGNHVENIPWEGIDTHGGEALVIVGNTVVSCHRGIALVVGNADRTTVPLRCVVSGNFVDMGTNAVTDREGISLWGLSGNLASATITGNRVTGYQASKAIYLDPNVDLAATLVQGNSHPHVPWTDLTITSSAWTPHATYPPQYMVDGRTVTLRGFVIAAAANQGNTTITQLPNICKGTQSLQFIAVSHGSNIAAGMGTLTVSDTAVLSMYYKTGTDVYSYPISASYSRN